MKTMNRKMIILKTSILLLCLYFVIIELLVRWIMKENIKTLINEHSSLHIECSRDIANIIKEIILENQNASFLDENEKMYEYMKVKEYLQFFAQITGHKNLLESAIEYMHLSDLLYVKIEKCTYHQKRRILIAREIIKDSKVYYFEEPIRNLDEDSTRMILSWFEEAMHKEKKIITSSRSLKEIYMCNGYHVSIHRQMIKPIEQEQDIQIEDENIAIQKISVKANEKIFLFNPEDIDYIEASDGKANVIVRGETYQATYSMDELENKLHRFGFYRCHRSYLVNMQRVTQVIKWTRNSYSLKLLNYEDTTVPLSKLKIQELKDLYQF